jgi:RNA polymerase sigma factor (sigma-70 family)
VAAAPDLRRATGVEPHVAPEATATQELYERYSGQLLGFCFHKLGNREEAEDAVQQTFLNAFRGLQRGIRPEAESAWLFKIAENVCLTRRRSSFRRGRVESPGDMQALQDFVAAPQRMGTEELIQLQEALAAMPATQRKAILLREWQGLSYHEIAEEMALSQSAVETLIFRARRSLAEGLERRAERTSAVSRVRSGLDAGSLLAALKTLFTGAAAAKAVATTAAAVTVAGVAVATAPGPRGQEAPRAPYVTPVEQSSATAAPRAAVAPVVRDAPFGERSVAPSPQPVVRIAREVVKTAPAPAVAAPAAVTAPSDPTRTSAPTSAPAPAPAQPEPSASVPAAQGPTHAPAAARADRPAKPEKQQREKPSNGHGRGPAREPAQAAAPTRAAPTRAAPTRAAAGAPVETATEAPSDSPGDSAGDSAGSGNANGHDKKDKG